jgi:hypothetical protein
MLFGSGDCGNVSTYQDEPGVVLAIIVVNVARELEIIVVRFASYL